MYESVRNNCIVSDGPYSSRQRHCIGIAQDIVANKQNMLYVYKTCGQDYSYIMNYA